MARKSNGQAAAAAPPASSNAQERPAPAEEAPRRPAASWRYPAASGVTIETAAWPQEIPLQSGETITVFNITVTRSYRDDSGQWHKGGSFRAAEVPVLIHALQRAHAFALESREMNCPL